MQVAENRVVSIHYRLTGDDGAEIDASSEGEPLAYLHGKNNILPGLEKELAGKEPGDSVEVTVAPEEGYGSVDDELIQVVPREAFQGVEDLQPGMRFEARDGQGNAHNVVVTEIGEQGVTVDGNHPLAGMTLHFDVTVEDVREATPEEVEHGPAH